MCIAVLLLTLAEHISLPVVSIADDLWLCHSCFCVFIFPMQFLQTVAVIVAICCDFLLRFPPDTVAVSFIEIFVIGKYVYPVFCHTSSRILLRTTVRWPLLLYVYSLTAPVLSVTRQSIPPLSYA